MVWHLLFLEFCLLPNVSIGTPSPRACSVAKSRDTTTASTNERNLSQETDGRSRPSNGYIASLRVSQAAANHGGSATEGPEVTPVMISPSQPDDLLVRKTGTSSFTTRQEQDSLLDQLKARTTNGPSLGNKKVYMSPFSDNVKTPDLLNCQIASYAQSQILIAHK